MSLESERQLERELSEEFLRKMVAWQNLENSLSGGYTVVDLRLAEIRLFPEDRFRAREEVGNWLQDHIERTPPDLAAGRLHIARCDGLLVFNRATLGERLPLGPYLQRTLGIAPAVIPDNQIQEQKDMVEALFSNLGFSFTDAGWQRFQEDERPTSEKTQKAINDAQEQLVPIILDTIDRPDLPLDFQIRVRRLNRPFVSRLIGGPDRFDHEVNVHPRNRYRYFRGMEEPLEVHEFIYHLIQALCLRDNVRGGSLSLDKAITTIPGMEQWANESMAQALPFFVPELLDHLSDYGRFALEYNLLRDMVLNNNVLIFANADGYTDRYIQDYVRTNLVGQPADRIISELVYLRREDPRYRSYYYSYTGSHYLRDEAARLSEGGKKATLKYSYNNLATPTQLIGFVDQQKAA